MLGAINMKINIIFGSPGSGKGTRGPGIAERLNAIHISTGDLFRDQIRRRNELGTKVEIYQKSGDLVPDNIADPFIFSNLDWHYSLSSISNCKVHRCNILLDGYPRTVEQCETLIKWVKESGNEIGEIINLVADKQVIIARIAARRICSSCSRTYNLISNPPLEEGVCDACNDGKLILRPDDEPEVTEYRLEIFEEKTHPVLERFVSKGYQVTTINTEKE